MCTPLKLSSTKLSILSVSIWPKELILRFSSFIILHPAFLETSFTMNHLWLPLSRSTLLYTALFCSSVHAVAVCKSAYDLILWGFVLCISSPTCLLSSFCSSFSIVIIYNFFDSSLFRHPDVAPRRFAVFTYDARYANWCTVIYPGASKTSSFSCHLSLLLFVRQCPSVIFGIMIVLIGETFSWCVVLKRWGFPNRFHSSLFHLPYILPFFFAHPGLLLCTAPEHQWILSALWTLRHSFPSEISVVARLTSSGGVLNVGFLLFCFIPLQVNSNVMRYRLF